MFDISLPHFEFPVLEAGWVWLAGAGPGDPGLLSLHALNGLQQADVIVYDALVDERILQFAGDGAEIIYAGKRGGKPSPKQSSISIKLVELAKSGKRVMRLKGGDPFVFGRGGEEALALVDAGVPFRIIPGITAGVGGLAYAGIPSTHRGINQAVTFLTGHDQNGVAPDELDWDALAKGSPVIVMYMAMKHISLITQKLINGGRRAAEPVAVICNATQQTQQVLETTLSSCAEDIASSGLKPPAIVVVGEVVNLREQLNWIEPALARTSQPSQMKEEPAL
ncbi:uroporphyrinogen-III C-methyltransferase [Pseudovibrio ascidiaceicola]|uniref:uroporphyrinogen-III C-methyltransferase n=1 Tax=Pseudovibrio ascidiaceicola TaxID=285279 RepID=A0A1I3W5Y9_9HYPH|nr:uroporphyrinogen-III C-methyltransferase [Pseudovibrio ascidiaceicola]SFK01831.1 uroporphyrinogen-III C-methyltransferase [Pseudovibrio ascidiaceicola]